MYGFGVQQRLDLVSGPAAWTGDHCEVSLDTDFRVEVPVFQQI